MKTTLQKAPDLKTVRVVLEGRADEIEQIIDALQAYPNKQIEDLAAYLNRALKRD
jgi:hypothetical protein